MAKELYLYSPIYDFVAQDLIAQMEDCNGDDITLRVNSPGGNVFNNYGICAKMAELGNVSVKVDGAAMSSAANMLLFAKDVEALDVSTFIFHRADMYVSSPEDQALLDNMNNNLKAKMKAKIDPSKFKDITGVSIDEMYADADRKPVILTAKQAKAIGLVNKITKLMPAEVEAFNQKMFAIAAEVKPTENQKPNKMTLKEIKTQFPDIYAEIKKKGAEEERNRVEAFLVFAEIDPKAVKEGIESGKDITPKMMAEFARKEFNASALKGIENDNAAPVVVDDKKINTTEEKKKTDAFLAEAKAASQFDVSGKK